MIQFLEFLSTGTGGDKLDASRQKMIHLKLAFLPSH